MLTKRLLLLPILTLWILSAEAKPPEITPHQTKRKVEEIMRSHVSHKVFSTEIASRTLQNYLELLDPTKTYLLEGEIALWDKPSDGFLDEIVRDYRKEQFTAFEDLYAVMLKAVDRRQELEKRVAKAPLPEKASASEFKSLEWAKSEDELFERLLKLRYLQLEVAKEFEDQDQDVFMQRVSKRRLKREEELTGAGEGEKESQLLVYFLKAVSTSLDNHTVYFTPAEANQFMIQVQQRLFGIGAQLRDNLNGFSIMKLLDGGPALTSKKLKVGDRIIAVGHTPVVGMEITEAVELIRGPKGSPVLLTIIREVDEGEDEKFDIEIVRDEIVLEETRYESHTEPYGDGIIGHIKLFSFYQDANHSSASDLQRIIDDMKSKHNLLGIVLDLRTNAGGLLPQAVAVTGLFIKKGVVVSIKDSNGKVQHLRAFNETPAWDGPLMVLTDRASASAAEIVAQTLQDYGRALLVGDPETYGKGSYQTFTFGGMNPDKVNPQGEFKVTRGMYFTVSGKSPQQTGAIVDLVIPGPYSEMEIGERYAKYPLENDSIDPNFSDELADVHPFHRHKLRRSYKHDRQEVLDLYSRYLPQLKHNSAMRIEQSQNYQNFLSILKMEDPSEEDLEPFGQNDLQYDETVSVMKDLLQLMAEGEKSPQMAPAA